MATCPSERNRHSRGIPKVNGLFVNMSRSSVEPDHHESKKCLCVKDTKNKRARGCTGDPELPELQFITQKLSHCVRNIQLYVGELMAQSIKAAFRCDGHPLRGPNNFILILFPTTLIRFVKSQYYLWKLASDEILTFKLPLRSEEIFKVAIKLAVLYGARCKPAQCLNNANLQCVDHRFTVLN